MSIGYNAMILPNISLSPSIPWSVPLGLLYIWLVFKYFNGKGKPASTSVARSEGMRARRLSGEEWKATIIPMMSVMVFFIAVTFISYRLIEIPADDMTLPDMPWWTLYSALIMISIVAGVSEEAGFRGYMQGPLEKRYGPVFAIGVAAVFFWLAHLNHASGVARAPALIVMGASLGALTYCARSVVPAIITHATADTIVFTGSTADRFLHELWFPVLLKESGVDTLFVVVSAVVVVSSLVMVITLKKLRSVTLA